jgi:hypothetical protein
VTTRRATEIVLEYTGGRDEPERGVFRNFPVDPEFTSELIVAVRSDEDPADRHWRQAVTGGRLQVHLAGSSRALEELGRYLIALARLQTADPEPHASLDDVRDADGGVLRLLTRRVKE